jgi:3-oxoacyl-[acyl-carrier protein] reductase
VKDQVAVVTGGTRGIGRAISLLLAANQARVFSWYRANDQAAAALAQECPALQTTRVDVCQRANVQAALKDIIAACGRIDILVNNAGSARDGFFTMMSDADWDEVIRTNLFGTYTVTKEVVKEMIFRRAGRIVNVASLSGVTGLPAQTNYSAAKGGVIAFTKALALEVARFGILVNAVSPGLIETELVQTIPENKRAKMLEQIPLGRLGQPEEVAQLVLFLASERNTYVTGQNFVISGGLYT